MLITPQEALGIILDRVRPLPVTALALLKVAGCYLARPVRADRDMPPADRSAMDGFAVRAADTARCDGKLRLIGEVAAGSPARPAVAEGTCVRILTGANIPPGADAVVPQEVAEHVDEHVRVLKPVRVGDNIRRRGEEARKADLLLDKGTLLGPAEVGLCAAVGKATLAVHSRPRVALLCTGSELRTASRRVAAHEVRNSNGPAIEASLRAEGFDLLCNDVVSDDIDVLVGRLRRAAKAHDVIVLSGGVSVGRYDYVPEAVTRIGAKVRFHGVRIKPGKPVLYATLEGNRHIFGLPGNPLSALNALHEFLLPALRRLAGAPADRCRPALHVPLHEPGIRRSGRFDYVPARLVWNGCGPHAVPVESQGSADVASSCRADGMIVLPEGYEPLLAGSLVEFRPWRALR